MCKLEQFHGWRPSIIGIGMAVAALLTAVVPVNADAIPYQKIQGVPAAVNSLGLLIAREQRSVVTPGGDETNPGFSSADQAEFEHQHRLRSVVKDFKNHKAFVQGVAVLKALPKDSPARKRALARFREPLYPTWAQNGHIGSDGTTDAGYAVEEEIADALTKVVEASLQTAGKAHHAR